MKENIPKWLIQDNEKRTGKYSRDIDDELFLRKLNEVLAESAIDKNERLESFPAIFFFGVPRCGKTFFSQMMVHLLDLGYPDNIIARFWKSPYTGIRLSKILRKVADDSLSFESDYGKTKGLFDPHDFAYYWHDHLQKKSHPYDFKNAKSTIDWGRLNSSLEEFTSAFGKSAILKGVNPSYHINEIASAYPKSYFIYIKRDFIDAAVSLYRGRNKNYGNVNHWYGQTPEPEVYFDLKERPYYEQIGGQFKYLTELYEAQLGNLDSNRQITINYNEFCNNPMEVIHKIKADIKREFDVEIQERNQLQEGVIKFSTHDEDLPYYEELLKGIKAFGLAPRITVN